MTEEQIALARRAVDCDAWRWMPGMLVVDSRRFGEWPFRVCNLSSINLRDDPGALPDLTDPATLGCLLALVREATTAYASLTFEPGYLHTEVENLVAALEAAPQ